ncbi:hypothetical protein ACS5PN_06210 [Roseateles sp. NT4]|uniref:hypothetical protein n=1 Tax=Roseateles sp. NT4 TaxID=3453715 RepID=UPI003EE97257
MEVMALVAACRAALAEGAPLPSPLAFADAVREANLDGSLESMGRLDRLLHGLHHSSHLTPHSLDEMAGGEAFLILSAVAVGLAVERRAGVSIEWLDRSRTAARMPELRPLLEERWTRLMAVVDEETLNPLAHVESALFEGGVSCESRVIHDAKRLQERQLRAVADIDQNARCREVLEALAAGRRLPDGLAYLTALKQAQLDYSAPSLARLDALLKQLREQVKPRHGPFIADAPTRNFMQAAAFYAAMCTARLGQLSIKWLNLPELTALQGPTDFEFETASGCLLDGKLYFPLALVSQLLFLADPPHTLEAWSRTLRLTASSPMISLKRQMVKGLPSAELPAEWAAAVRQAGHFAAQSLFMVEGGSVLVPQVLEPQGKGMRVVAFGMQADDAAYEASMQRLQANPGKLPWQVRATDGYANLPTGRTDAITIELHCYPGGFLTQRKPLSLTLACPYRNASDARGFAIYSPKLLSCDAPAPALAGLFKQFYDGVYSFRIDTAGTRFSWDRYLDESV